MAAGFFDKVINDARIGRPQSVTQTISRSYTPPATIRQFMLSTAFVRIIMGPFGSGKSSGAVMEVVRRCKEQKRGPDGKRHSRWAVVRNTNQQLKDTTFKTWCDWIPPGAAGEWKETEKTFYLRFDDVEAEILFRPLDTPDDIKRLLSLELTGAWFNEARETPIEIIDAMQGRVGRYPSTIHGGCTWRGIICDTNPPDEDSDFHKFMTKEKPDNVACFYQPSGMDPKAENRENLPSDYYEQLMVGKSQNWMDVYVHGKFGIGLSGKAVYAGTFDHKKHLRQSLLHAQNKLVVVGMDFNMNPAAVAQQLVKIEGGYQLRQLCEWYAADCDVERFIITRLKPGLMVEFPGCPVVVVGDPTGVNRGGPTSDTAFKTLKRNNLKAVPAHTNHISPRIGAVVHYLTQNLGSEPMLLVDQSRCPRLVEGYKGKYKYAMSSKTETSDKPDKTHPWSDLHDCGQYACLYMKDGRYSHLVQQQTDSMNPVEMSNMRATGYTPNRWD